MKRALFFALGLVLRISNGQSITANSERLFGEYSLSAAADARACPKKLVIKDLQPYVSIPKSFSLPVSNLVFDGVQCTTGNQRLELYFGGDNDGRDETLPSGTCFDTNVAKVAWVVTPGKYPNGTFSFWDPNQPLVSRFEVNGDCTYCTYSKPFNGTVKEGFFKHRVSECAGKKVYQPVKGLGEPPPKEQIKYFINTKCERDGRLWARGGVVYAQRHRVENSAVIEVRVESNRNTYSAKSLAHCPAAEAMNCIDWRRWPVEIVVPRSGLKVDVLITVLVNGREVKARHFYVNNGCDNPNV